MLHNWDNNAKSVYTYNRTSIKQTIKIGKAGYHILHPSMGFFAHNQVVKGIAADVDWSDRSTAR